MGIERIKAHINKHKVVYSCGTTAITVAGITYLIIGGRYAVVGNAASDGLERVTVRPLSFFSHHNNVVTVIERDGRGHPGYITHCIETGKDFATQGEAARKYGISSTVMSKHINGILENANGFHFERRMAD